MLGKCRHILPELSQDCWTGGDIELGDREPVFDLGDKDVGYNDIDNDNLVSLDGDGDGDEDGG